MGHGGGSVICEGPVLRTASEGSEKAVREKDRVSGHTLRDLPEEVPRVAERAARGGERLTPLPKSGPQPGAGAGWQGMTRRNVGDAVFKNLTLFFAMAVFGIVILMALEMVKGSLPSMQAFGWKFL